jgi:hypothetical protein
MLLAMQTYNVLVKLADWADSEEKRDFAYSSAYHGNFSWINEF